MNCFIKERGRHILHIVKIKRSPDEILQNYVPMVHYIADIIGPLCEVVLQDMRNPNCSIIAIRNGYVSGRNIGGPLTNLALKIMEGAPNLQEKFLSNYTSKNSHGEDLISSTYFIRDDEKKIIGMLCVNILKSGFQSIMPPDSRQEQNGTISEHHHRVNEYLYASSDQIIIRSVQDMLDERHLSAENITFAEKKELIFLLKKNGIFKIKGSVPRVGMLLDIAASTIYRYLSQNEK